MYVYCYIYCIGDYCINCVMGCFLLDNVKLIHGYCQLVESLDYAVKINIFADKSLIQTCDYKEHFPMNVSPFYNYHFCG